MTNAACTNPNPYNGQIALNDYADMLLCSKCKRCYWNDMDDYEKVNSIDIHNFYGNQFVNLMARSGRKDLVQKEVERQQKENSKSMEDMKKEYLKKLQSEKD